MKNLASFLPSILILYKLFEKFQRFNAVDRSIEMLKNSQISKHFNYNVKCFTRLKQRTALRKSFSLPHSTR